MRTQAFEAFTLAGKPARVRASSIDSTIKSTAAINAVLGARDPGFVQVMGFVLAPGLMTAQGDVIPALALVFLEDYDGEETLEWWMTPPLEAMEAEGQALLAKAAAAAVAAAAAAVAAAAAAVELEAASLLVVPPNLRAEWLAEVEKLRECYRLSPIQAHIIRVGGGFVAFRPMDGMPYWSTAQWSYDGGGSGYGRHAD